MPIDVKPTTHTAAFDAACLIRVAFEPEPAQGLENEEVVHTGLRPLAGTAAAEDWIGCAPVVRGCDASFHYAHDGEVCFGWLYIDAGEPLEAATQAAYSSAFRVFDALGFAHLLRAWHYLPNLHAQEEGRSRYRCFCRGRFAAFEAAGRRSYCAATVVGTRACFGVMCFLAARKAGVAVENPRQVSAWRYPSSSLRERPLFARAVYKTWGDRIHFYGSGTASIVGHESRHPDDAAAQLSEALLNLRELLDATPYFREVERLSRLKLYVTDPADVDKVRAALAASRFSVGSTAWFEAEICRRDLCVEIEALII